MRLQAGSDVFDAQTQFAPIGGARQTVVPGDLKGRAQITVIFEIYPNQGALDIRRYGSASRRCA